MMAENIFECFFIDIHANILHCKKNCKDTAKKKQKLKGNGDSSDQKILKDFFSIIELPRL